MGNPPSKPKLPVIPKNPIKPIIKPIVRTVGTIKDKVTNKKTYYDMLNKLNKTADFIEDKARLLTKKLDDAIYGFESSSLSLSISDELIKKAASNVMNDIMPPIRDWFRATTKDKRNLSSILPENALKNRTVELILSTVLIREINVLKISKNTLSKQEFIDMIYNTATGRKIADRIKQNLPEKIRNLVG